VERNDLLRKLGLAVFLGGLATIALMLCIKQGLAIGFAIYALPLLLVFLFCCIKSPLTTFLLVYITSFGILGLARYVEMPIAPGLVIDILLLLNFLVILFQYLWGKEKVGVLYANPVLIMSLLWMFFCLLQVINPMASLSNWSTTVRNIGIHIVVFQVLVFFVLNDLKKLNLFFLTWGVLVLLATLKALGQKFIGFDSAEMAWLDSGGARTHLIHSGARYFSFYTDAANFGCNMGLSLVLFTILATHEKNRARRIFYIIVILCSTYSFMISGTRAAVAVPFVGFATWVVLVKEWRWIFGGALVIVLTFAFFTFTKIGDGNADIRRMRTAFEFTEDASFNVRLENQEKMRAFMRYYPFGIGMGSAKNTQEGDLMYGLATDSSMVFIWVETGIVGLIFYILLFVVVLAYGTYYVWKVLKDPAIKTITSAATAGLAGMIVAGYANEVLHQLPTGQTVYILIGIIMMSPYLDKKQLEHG